MRWGAARRQRHVRARRHVGESSVGAQWQHEQQPQQQLSLQGGRHGRSQERDATAGRRRKRSPARTSDFMPISIIHFSSGDVL